MNTSGNNNQVNNNRVVNTNKVVNNNANNVASEPVIRVSTDVPGPTVNTNVVQNAPVNSGAVVNNTTLNNQVPNVNVTKVVNPTTTNNNVPPDNNISNNEDKPKKGGIFKTILLILFFILLFVFVMFLPEISNYVRYRNVNSDDNEIKNGNLVCEMDKNTDLTDVSYQYSFVFTNKQLMSSSINTTTSSEAKDVIGDEYNKCQIISDISRDVDGIEVTCTTSDNITTIIQSNDYRLIDNDNLTKFTEAGGIYPEFMYKDNIYTIQNKMIRSGYDCEIKAK